MEGSKENDKSGEYVIDFSEYYDHSATQKRIKYFQLKHTTTQLNSPFTLSGLKDTITGFAERYQQMERQNATREISFTVVTNRGVKTDFKEKVNKVANGKNVDNRFLHTLTKYTGLSGEELQNFCQLLYFEDSEGNYQVQQEELRIEMSRLQPGIVDPAQLDSLVALVQERVLPHSRNEILKEDVLRPFGMTSMAQLFPAPPFFETLKAITAREQYDNILNTIITSNTPIIIQATGGVGKSVFTQYVLEVLPEHSIGIAYDCFGAGKYRSRSEPRHRHRDALVQIINELAVKGLCERMLVGTSTTESDIMRGFLNRLQLAINALKVVNQDANIVVLIDAADNAEMAAEEYGDTSFAHELLRESFPTDCKLVMLCRPERTDLLQPSEFIKKIDLLPFTESETLDNSRKRYPEVNKYEAQEFHKLTSGNPRVQMNSMAAGYDSFRELLSFLGPAGTTVEQQIEQQLSNALGRLKNDLPKAYQDKVNRICTGLASLPPNIPVDILAKVADVSPEDVQSFATDIGHPLWLGDGFVRFKDEPTETWFRDVYTGSSSAFNDFISLLSPFARESAYVAQVLPQLYLQAGNYTALVELALSEKLLPKDNPIDTRNVLIYRLQFAFKAALRSKKYKDAIKLALRAGEEMAGDQRQQDLFKNNTDLLTRLQHQLKVEEIAFQGRISSGWEGSENIYTASLLSGLGSTKGEASSYLRSATNWLKIYFDARKRSKGQRREESDVSEIDILEFALAHLNLRGAKACIGFLEGLKPKTFVFRVVAMLTSRLIDAGRLEDVNALLKISKQKKYYTVAIVSELSKVGRTPKAKHLKKCLSKLSNPKERIRTNPHAFKDPIIPAVIDFLEACLKRRLDKNKIEKALGYYVSSEAGLSVASNFASEERTNFLRAIALRKAISPRWIINLEELMPKAYLAKPSDRNYSDDIRDFKELVGSLIPWFTLRIQVICGDTHNFLNRANEASKASQKASASRYRSYDRLPIDVVTVISNIAMHLGKDGGENAKVYYETYLNDNPNWNIPARISLTRSAGISSMSPDLLLLYEGSTYHLLRTKTFESPEETANHFVSLARAVFARDRDNAAVYFEEAIEAVSKFGDEVVARWEAIVSLGERSSSVSTNELAYRFIRICELVGNYVDREKHWDRSKALIVCAKMSASVAISALSRWRDRDVGRFGYLLEDLLIHLMKTKSLEATEAWSVGRLTFSYRSNRFTKACLSHTSTEIEKHEIFTDAYELTLREGVESDDWKRMRDIADSFQIEVEKLRFMPAFHRQQIGPSENSNEQNELNDPEIDADKWDSVFDNLNLIRPEHICLAMTRFTKIFTQEDNYQPRHSFYERIAKQIELSELNRFVFALLESDEISDYGFRQIVNLIPAAWKARASFEKQWPQVIYLYGVKFAVDLTEYFSFDYAIRELSLGSDLVTELRRGIFEGLSKGQMLTEARTLFGFVRQATNFVSPTDAANLTEYALNRFEMHAKESLGDGPWGSWLEVPSEINLSVAGLIWSALGSPRTTIRWATCHAVKKLGDFHCVPMLNNLIKWLKLDECRAFGSKEFPFYRLHARQYLLIALLRVSVDHAHLLVHHKGVFFEVSQSTSHVLIQKFSAEIALNIEHSFPGTYDENQLSILKGIGRPKCEIQEEKFGYTTDSFYHKSGQVDTSLRYAFGMDTERYWYDPLGRVFGVPGQQIGELCANVIVKEWGENGEGGYYKDPRVGLWNEYSNETHHTHGSYPRVDNLDFYLSYHAMMSVAAKLLDSMPIIDTKTWPYENAWEDWLSHHSLTRGDGKWKAGFRDVLPINRPAWIINKRSDEQWRLAVEEDDFIKGLVHDEKETTWLHIRGSWTERQNMTYETYTVSSALVNSSTSEALMRALATCSDPRDYKIPDYEDSNMEFNFGKFWLKGYVLRPESTTGIDSKDPYSNDVRYPPLRLGDSYIKDMNLTPDREEKNAVDSNGKLVTQSQTWKSSPKGTDEEADQSGSRLSASLAFLVRLCRTYRCDLIFEVNISRDIEYKYRKEPDKYEYKTYSKIYLLSEDGKLRSTTGHRFLR